MGLKGFDFCPRPVNGLIHNSRQFASAIFETGQYLHEPAIYSFEQSLNISHSHNLVDGLISCNEAHLQPNITFSIC